MIDIRVVVAADLVLHGRKLILGEFALGCLVSAGVGLWLLIGGAVAWQRWLGLYLLTVGFNYAPFFAAALRMNALDAAALIADHGSERRDLRRYTLQSLLLLVPLFTFVVAARRGFESRS